MLRAIRRNRALFITGMVSIVVAVAADYLHVAEWVVNHL